MTDPSSEPDLLDRLAHEFAERCRRGEQPALTEYADRHPALAAEIRELFPAMAAMEAIGSSGGSGRAVLVAEPPVRLGEYRILREVGRGGMGVVYEAIQESLGRHVALKVLPARTGIRGNALERFKREARAAANLHHTNIVPVFGVGDADGVHYYAMQFIAGQGLDAVLGELRRLRDKDSAPSADPKTVTLAANLASGQFPPPAVEPDAPADPLAATASGPAQVGSTVLSGSSDLAGGPHAAYFSTVARLGAQVADALAHAHAQRVVHRDVKPSNLLLDAHGTLWVTDFGLAQVEGAGDLTMPGDVVGTVRYMAPERFAGKADARSDVYGLGLTLYELLTLRPGFDDSDRMKLIDRIRTEDPPRPRSTDPRIPRDLELIVRKAIARDPADRYASAADFAADLGRFLHDEPVRARRSTLLLRTRKWARRNRRVVTAGAVGLLVAFAAVAGSLGWAVRDRAARKEEAAQESARKLAQTQQGMREALARAVTLRGDLHAVLKKPGGVQELLNQPARWDLFLQMARADVRQAQGLRTRAEGSPDVELTQALDTLDRQLATDEADRRLAADLEKVRLDKASMVEGGFDCRKAADEYPRVFASAGFANLQVDSAVVAGQMRASPIQEQLVSALDDWAYCAFRERKDGELVEKLLAVARQVAPEPAWGDRLRDLKVWRDKKAIAELARSAPAGLPPQELLLVGLLLDRNDQLAWMLEARDKHPGDFWLNHYLANALERKSRYVEAVGYCRVALALRPRTPIVYNTLGIAFLHHKKLPEAIGAFHTAIELAPEYPNAYINLSIALIHQEKFPEALAALDTAIKLAPKDADAYFNLGNALRGQKRLPDAIAAYHKAIELNPEYAPTYNNLGVALHDQQKLPEAIAAYHKAIELDPEYAPAYYNLGIRLREQNRLPEAIAAYQEAIKLDPDHAQAYNNLGAALKEQGKVPEAIAAFQKAFELNPKLPQACYNLGSAFYDQKKLPEAISAYRKTIELDKDYLDASHRLGKALRDQGKWDEAIAVFREVIRRKPDDDQVRFDLGGTYAAKQAWKDAIDEWQKLIDRQPIHFWAHCNVANAFRNKGEFDVAISWYRKTIRLDPKVTEAHLELGWTFEAKQAWTEAIAEFREAIRIEANNLAAHQRLATLLLCCPDPSVRNARQAVEHATKVAQLNRSSQSLQLLGWAHYRAGSWHESLEALEKSCGTGDAGQWIVMSLAHWKLSTDKEVPEAERARHVAESQRLFERADKQIDQWWRARPGHELGQVTWDFRAEARALLAAKGIMK